MSGRGREFKLLLDSWTETLLARLMLAHMPIATVTSLVSALLSAQRECRCRAVYAS
jgi:hypothetical protein